MNIHINYDDKVRLMQEANKICMGHETTLARRAKRMNIEMKSERMQREMSKVAGDNIDKIGNMWTAFKHEESKDEELEDEESEDEESEDEEPKDTMYVPRNSQGEPDALVSLLICIVDFAATDKLGRILPLYRMKISNVADCFGSCILMPNIYFGRSSKKGVGAESNYPYCLFRMMGYYNSCLMEHKGHPLATGADATNFVVGQYFVMSAANKRKSHRHEQGLEGVLCNTLSLSLVHTCFCRFVQGGGPYRKPNLY